MSNQPNRRVWYFTKILFALFIMVVPVVYIAAPPAVLMVQEHQTGKVLFKKSVNIGEEFTLDYVHSITKQPVQEIYYVKDNKTLALKEMHYDSFGSNLPVGSESLADEETKFTVEDDHYKITYENRSFTRVPLRVGQMVADHTLLFNDGSRLRFLNVTEGGAYINFYVKPFLNSFRHNPVINSLSKLEDFKVII